MKIRIGKTTDYFLSSHTTEGYHSFFAQAMADNEQLIGLAGASAQIRSRVCRQLAIQLVDRGYNVELIHGLANPCDLEGIIVPELSLMVADGEKLRESEERWPTVALVDLNEYIWEERYPIFEAKLRDLQEQMSVNLELVYEHLHQAQSQLVNPEGGLCFSEPQSQRVVERLARSLFFKQYGRLEHRFGQSLTGEGRVDYYRGLLRGVRRKYYLNGVNYRSGCKVLSDLSREAIKAGLVCQVYHDYLDAELVELLIIPELETAVAAKALDEDFQELLTYKETACQPAIIQESLPKVDESLGRVTAILQEIKTQSGVVGELYQDMIDFEAIERLEEELLYKVLKQNKNGEE